MVNFRKRLAETSREKILDPIKLYETLDRASNKGPLRAVQERILSDWHTKFRSNRDVILKLHTGQGKTLIGLLILQSKIHESEEPVVYLCPNNFLVRQTIEQARQFGISACETDGELPIEFLDGKKILVTSVQKLFNGLTKFGLGLQSIKLNSVLLDDAHACIDSIRDAFLIRIEKDNQAYNDLLSLFSDDLEKQGAGTYADIRNHLPDSALAVPYWAWEDRNSEVSAILSKYSKHIAVKFAWPVLRDILKKCHCVFSGKAVEIAPYLAPLPQFGSYYDAKHRVFMSATISDDAFLVKGLRIPESTIRNPLHFVEEKWSGEKMILIPSLIDPKLDRSAIVAKYAPPNPKAKSGTVAIVPSAKSSIDWGKYGAIVSDRESITEDVSKLRSGDFVKTVVIVNRYDGIDLPDEICRILIVDSRPHSENLYDTYVESCRSGSDVSAIRTARTIEQGLGRSVRGEKDYSVIILIGPELIRAIRTKELKKHLSKQTAAQIELALEIVEMSREEIEDGKDAEKVFSGIIKQCLDRDEEWKQFYQERMNAVDFSLPESSALTFYSAELDAECLYMTGKISDAVARIQQLIDDHVANHLDRGWYMQTMARYLHSASKSEANKMQINAHAKNTYILKPATGMVVKKLGDINQKRVDRIATWLRTFDSFEELSLTVTAMLDRFSFGVEAEPFERTTGEIATALGFENQRPDKEWGEGPDNLWCLRDGEFLLLECKSEANIDRSEISKREADQMNRATAWFKKYYPSAKVKNIMVIPTHVLSSSAHFLDEVGIVRDKELRALKAKLRAFFDEFRDFTLNDLTERKIHNLLEFHGLDVESITNQYSQRVISKRRT